MSVLPLIKCRPKPQDGDGLRYMHELIEGLYTSISRQSARSEGVDGYTGGVASPGVFRLSAEISSWFTGGHSE